MTHADQVMLDAGWFPGRTVDLQDEEAALASTGYRLSEAAKPFLSEVSGLVFHFNRHGRSDSIWFDPARAVTLATAETIAAVEQQMEGRLLPIGCGYHDHLLLWLSQEGRLIATYDNYCADLGTSAQDAIRKLVAQDLPQQPGSPDRLPK